MKEETGVRIDSGELQSILECTICYTNYTEPTMTKCGHTYCRKCIEACLARNSECPDCKTKLLPADLTRNIQIERVQRQIAELQERAKKDPMGDMPVGQNYVASPVVGIFQANLKDCLSKFNSYCDKLRGEMEERKKQIAAKYAQRLAAGASVDPAAIKAEEAKETAAVEQRFRALFDALIQEYDRYMKEVVPEPQITTLKVVVHVPSKGVRIENVNLRPYDTMREVRSMVERSLDAQKNPVLKWGEVHYIILDPAHAHLSEVGPDFAAVVVSDEVKPLYECKVVPGSKILVQGAIMCASDAPKPCITHDFRKEEKKAYNYYSCDTCSLNWICEPCAQQCHKGHEIKEYLRAHVPTWACCYCMKKACILPNKSRPAASMFIG